MEKISDNTDLNLTCVKLCSFIRNARSDCGPVYMWVCMKTATNLELGLADPTNWQNTQMT